MLSYGLYQLKHIELYGKPNEGLKSYTELAEMLKGKVEIDNRTGEEIEKDVLSLFKNNNNKN